MTGSSTNSITGSDILRGDPVDRHAPLCAGSDIDIARELLIGRIHAMSNVVSLLSESQWQGVKIKGLFAGARHTSRRTHRRERPDVTVSARRPKSLSLLFSNWRRIPTRGLSLSQATRTSWRIGKLPVKASTLRFISLEEFNTSEATRRPDSDFRPHLARSCPRRRRLRASKGILRM